MCLVGHKKRGWGWGPTPIGLRGGGESAIANGGSSGWGPPPPANAGASRGWGAVPPNPNPAASAGWGAAPNPAAAPGPLAVAAAVNNGNVFISTTLSRHCRGYGNSAQQILSLIFVQRSIGFD